MCNSHVAVYSRNCITVKFAPLFKHRMASTMEKLFLKAVVAEFRRSGLEEATFEDVSWLRHSVVVVLGLGEKHMRVKHSGTCL